MIGENSGVPEMGSDGMGSGSEAWEEPREAPASDALIVDVEGFEGPLDLLLALARTHKLDLTKISILALAQQYLDFIERARSLKLEIAADYLVMAAWLAFLKSRLLLPREEEPEGEPTAAELAARLAFRLKRLEAMREAAAKLMARNRLGRDVFARGAPEPLRLSRESRYEATIYDLLSAYAEQRQRTIVSTFEVPVREVWSLQEARERLERLLGERLEWAPLEAYLQHYLGEGADARSVVASSLGALLEMAREGVVEISQAVAFGPLYVRRKRRDGGGKPERPNAAKRLNGRMSKAPRPGSLRRAAWHASSASKEKTGVTKGKKEAASANAESSTNAE